MTLKDSPSLSPRRPGHDEEWRRQEREAIRTAADLDGALRAAGLDPARRRGIVAAAAAAIPSCSMRITPYYFGLIENFSRKDPVFLQAVPGRGEIEKTPLDREDPVGDRSPENRPVEAVIHRYADRALFVPTWRCAVHCRFCFRRDRERAERPGPLPAGSLEEGIRYIEDHPGLREVILSGGDPLTLLDASLEVVFRNPVTHAGQFVWACEAMVREGAPEPLTRRMTPSVLERLPDTLTRKEFSPYRSRAKALLDGKGTVAVKAIEGSSNVKAFVHAQPLVSEPTRRSSQTEDK